MYELPSAESVTKVVVDESVIRGDSAPMLIYQNVEVEDAGAKTAGARKG